MNNRGDFIPFDQLKPGEIARWGYLTGHNTDYASPFFQYQFAKAVEISRGGVHVWLGRDSDGEIVEIFALQRRIKMSKFFGWERLGGELSDYCGTIVPSLISAEIDSVLARASICYFEYSHFPALLSEKRRGAVYTEAAQIHLNSGSKNYLDWLSGVNPKYFRDAARRWRKCEREYGALEFKWHDTNPDLVDVVIDHKRKQYARTRTRDCLEQKWARNLLRTIAMGNVDNDGVSMVLSSLSCRGRWIALHLGIESNGVLQMWFPVYQQEFSKFAPGRLLLLQIIENATLNGVSLIDRGDGCSEEKLQTANALHRMRKHHFRSPGSIGLFQRTICAIEWRTSHCKNLISNRILKSRLKAGGRGG